MKIVKISPPIEIACYIIMSILLVDDKGPTMCGEPSMPNRSAGCVSEPSSHHITANTNPTAIQQEGIRQFGDDDHIPKSKLLCLAPAISYIVCVFETNHKHYLLKYVASNQALPLHKDLK